jgi:hypothetical protein
MPQQLAIQADPGIRPGTRCCTMQDMQLIGTIDFCLGLLGPDGSA